MARFRLFNEEEGLTWRSLLAILVSAAVILPIQIYMTLATPVSVAWPAVILLLFTELAYFFHAPLSKQEGFIIYFVSAVAIGGSVLVEGMIPFLNFPYRVYMVQSPYFRALGFDKEVPWWFVPPLTSEAIVKRTIIHPDWSFYIGLLMIGFIIYLGTILPMTFILAQLYIEIEKLPFPIGKVQAETIISLTERDPERFDKFILSAVVGVLYSLALYGFPIITLTFFGRAFSVTGSMIWSFLDLTQFLQIFIPGAIFGISLDLLNVASAWVIPSYLVLTATVISILTYVVGNTIALRLPWDIFKYWQEDWFPGASLIWLYQRSYFDLWLSAYIGISLAAGIMPFILEYKNYVKAFVNLKTLPESVKKAGYISLTPLLVVYFLSAAASIALFKYLVPRFPIVLLFPFVAWGFIWPFISAWSIGMTGFAPAQPPLLREATILFSGYKELDVWFAGWVAQPGNAPGVIVNAFQVGYWCGVTPKTYLKAAFIAMPFLFIFSLVYVDMFWRMAPMPSAFYPWIEVTWPISVLNWVIWPTFVRKGFLPSVRLEVILTFFAVAAVLAVVLKLIKLPLAILIGVLWGVTSMPHALVGATIGVVVGKLLEKKLGKEKWDRDKVVIVAGLTLGNAVAIAFAASLLLISRSLWALPY
ncbi:MAG: hypothetical protein DRJ63_03585 [Thermoprotei archaeon]|nr:MAG: hypothetical protein DRJ63_03585 [Thermoprotei archaeon]